MSWVAKKMKKIFGQCHQTAPESGILVCKIFPPESQALIFLFQIRFSGSLRMVALKRSLWILLTFLALTGFSQLSAQVGGENGARADGGLVGNSPSGFSKSSTRPLLSVGILGEDVEQVRKRILYGPSKVGTDNKGVVVSKDATKKGYGKTIGMKISPNASLNSLQLLLPAGFDLGIMLVGTGNGMPISLPFLSQNLSLNTKALDLLSTYGVKVLNLTFISAKTLKQVSLKVSLDPAKGYFVLEF